MNFPTDCKYTKDHEWVRIEGDVAVVGITEFAQSELGDIVFIDLPAVGKKLRQHDTISVVESTKAASDVYSPLSGSVKEVNGELQGDPSLINKDPHGQGWIAKLDGISETDFGALMSADDYRKLINK